MKPIYYGYVKSEEKILLKPTKEINIPLLEKRLEQLLEDSVHQISDDRKQCYTECAHLYNTLFTHKCIPIEKIHDFSNEILEIARECIDYEMEDYIKQPYTTSQINYYYEYCRSLAVTEQISNLVEFLDEESDFIWVL